MLKLTVKVTRDGKTEIDEKLFNWPIDKLVKSIPQITGKQRYDLKVHRLVKYEQEGCEVLITITEQSPEPANPEPIANPVSSTESANPVSSL